VDGPWRDKEADRLELSVLRPERLALPMWIAFGPHLPKSPVRRDIALYLTVQRFRSHVGRTGSALSVTSGLLSVPQSNPDPHHFDLVCTGTANHDSRIHRKPSLHGPHVFARRTVRHNPPTFALRGASTGGLVIWESLVVKYDYSRQLIAGVIYASPAHLWRCCPTFHVMTNPRRTLALHNRPRALRHNEFLSD